jgi:multidrug efflux pump subunit AcrA (membrane-fusion protein)
VDFTGKVQRIDAAANSVTRQVEVLVTFDDAAKLPRVAGLYAEGRIEGSDAGQPTLDESSIVRNGKDTHVWRVGRDGRLAKTPVKLGERDPRTGEMPLRAGLAEGDQVLRHPGSTLVDGQQVELVKSAAANGVAVK